VYWEANTPAGIEIRAAYLSVPDGTVSQVTTPPPLPFVFGAVFDVPSKTWLGVDRSQLSPDGMRYVYWKGSPGSSEVHVVDLATRSDHTVYRGAELFIPIAFASDAIYLVHAINLRQSAFEKLYRLDPKGGLPTLVPGSDGHMYQYGWTKISGGAAWGLDNRVEGSNYTYLVERLDLTSGTAIQWLEGPANQQFAPLGTDAMSRLYVSDGFEVWRVARPGLVEKLLSPQRTLGALTFGATMVNDKHGAWFSARGGVYFLSLIHI